MNRIKAAAIQMDALVGDVDSNLEQAEKLIEQAAEQGGLVLVDVFLQEWFHAPLAILRMHWFSWQENEKATSDSTIGF